MKQNIYKIIESIQIEQSHIIDLSMQGKKDSIIALLTDCQQAAIDIGEAIEREEGQGTYAVVLLEQYCEQLYNTSQNLEHMDRLIKDCLGLSDLLKKIKENIDKEIATKYEVVFFPYKASMWDSLESVWMAAKENPKVEAYVVPIPYWDFNSDHSLGEMHYEGELYPDYVQITSWEEYHIEERRPDVVFIHNPYDKANHITTVHPDFYSSNIKKYTDLLVYIPYFVGLDDVEDGLCVVPATIHADKVIVQSEKVREIYIRSFRKFLKENKCEDLFPNYEEKFLALGSPKFDKVLSTKKEHCVIPESWRRLIGSEKNNQKKVVLYNTTLVALLANNEKMLDKIQYTLDVFKKDPTVVLLWRPHPLYKATCGAIRPQLLQQYEQIEEEYKREGWGIFDDTSDMNRAIAISDAYYGDCSSMVALFKVTGKPIMIQNTDVLSGDE